VQRQTNLIYLTDSLQDENSDQDETAQNSCYLIQKKLNSKESYEYAKQKAEQADCILESNHISKTRNQCFMIQVVKHGKHKPEANGLSLRSTNSKAGSNILLSSTIKSWQRKRIPSFALFPFILVSS
jgi:hypothetical protein